MIAALAATVTSASLLGNEPVIAIPQYRLEHAAEIPLYALLGVAAAVVGVAFIELVYRVEDRLRALPLRSPMLLPAVGGVLVGLLAIVDDGVLGEGESVMNDILNERTAIGAMLLLLALKPLAAASTLGSGGSGGVFGPSLFLGSLTGGIFGSIVHRGLPALTATSGVYATVGMAASFAAISHAPISAVLMLFEMTRDYGIMLPLMTAVAAATFTSQLIGRGSIYTIGLERRGVLIEDEPEPVSVMGSLSVADAMSPVPVTVAPDAPASEVMRALRGDPEASAIVVGEDGELEGIITNVNLNEAISSDDSDPPASEICSREVRTVFADQTLHEALGILGSRDLHSLPVVDRAEPGVVCGILRRSDITQAYASAMEHRDASQRRRRLAKVTGDDVRYLELRVSPQSGLGGRLLNELDLTEDAIVVAVRHDGMTMIPRGHTRLSDGDRVTVLAAGAVVDEVRATFEGRPPRPAR
jgi:CIC family chloride channel protein